MNAPQPPGPAAPLPHVFTPPSIAVRRMHRRFARLTDEGVRAHLLDIVRDEWVRMAVEDARGDDFRVLGLFAMRLKTRSQVGATAALLIQVRRNASAGRPERDVLLMLFLGEDLRGLKVAWRNGHAFPAANYIGGPGEVLKGAGPFNPTAAETDGHPLEAPAEDPSAAPSTAMRPPRGGTSRERRGTRPRAVRQRRGRPPAPSAR